MSSEPPSDLLHLAPLHLSPSVQGVRGDAADKAPRKWIPKEPFRKDALLPAPQPCPRQGALCLLWYNKDQSLLFLKFLDFEGSERLRQAAFMISNPEFSVHVVARASHPIALESPGVIKP